MVSEIQNSHDPFVLLKHEHAALDRLFLLHQEALINRGWARAMRLLEHYRQRLGVHIQIEDQLLLPCCAADANGSRRWQAQVYVAEHRRLEELVDKVCVRLAVIRRRGIKPAMLIELLDQEKTVKHMLEHHHEREEKGLYRELCEQLAAQERQYLIDTLAAHPVYAVQ